MTHSKKKYQVVIIGSGFSGIVAANILAEKNLDILLIDENPHIGGQLLRKPSKSLTDSLSTNFDYVKKIGFNFINNLKNKKITILNNTSVSGIYQPNQLMISIDNKKVRIIKYDYLIFATGAREKFLPFKGWTLPGVYSTGMVQVLIKSSKILPSLKMVIAGSGLFLFSVAYEYLKAGGKLRGIYELSGIKNKIKLLPSLLRFYYKLSEGMRYLSKISLSGNFVNFKTRVIEGRGKNSLEEIVVAKVTNQGEIKSGSEKVIKTNTLAIGYGFTPNIEGPKSAGCILEYQAHYGGWIVKVDSTLQSSIKNIFAAGEITGVGGALKSINEGKICANSILFKLGKTSQSIHDKNLKRLRKARNHHLRFAELFNSLYTIPPIAYQQIPKETIICRCESVTFGEIKKAIKKGCSSSSELKLHTRASMGNCQGRTCSPIIYDILENISDKSVQNFGFLSIRPPFKPLSINTLKNFKD